MKKLGFWVPAVLMCVLFFSFASMSVFAQKTEEKLTAAQEEKYGPRMNDAMEAFESKDLEKAVTIMKQLRFDLEKELGPVHFVVIEVSAGLANVYLEWKKPKEADGIFTDLFARLKKAKLEEAPHAVFVLVNQIELYKQFGDDKKVKEADVKLQALFKKYPEYKAMVEKDGGKDNSQETEFKKQLEEIFRLRDQGDMAAALEKAGPFLGETEEKFGPGHDMSIEVRRMIADIHRAMGNPEKAWDTLSVILPLLAWGKSADQRSLGLVFALEFLEGLASELGKDEDALRIRKSFEELLAKNPDLRKNYETDVAKREEMGDKKDKGKDGDKPGRGKSANQKYFEEMGNFERMFKQGKAGDAVMRLESLVKDARKVLAPEDPFFSEADMALARYKAETGNPQDAIRIMEDRIADLEKKKTPDPVQLLGAYMTLAGNLQRIGKLDNAVPLLQKAVAVGQKALDGAKNEGTKKDVLREFRNARFELAIALGRLGRLAEAEQAVEQALEGLGTSPSDKEFTLRVLTAKASILVEAKKTAGLDAVYERMAELFDELGTVEGMDIGDTLLTMADYYQTAGKKNQAAYYVKRARTFIDASKEGQEALRGQLHLFRYYFGAGEQAEAGKILANVKGILATSRNLMPKDRGIAWMELGRYQAETQKNLPEAMANFKAAFEAFGQDPQVNIQDQQNALYELKAVYEKQGNSAEALKILDQIQALGGKGGMDKGNNPRMDIRVQVDKANVLRSQSKQTEAEKLIAAMVPDIEKKYGSGSTAHALALIEQAWFYNPNPNSKVDIKILFDKAVQILEKSPGTESDMASALTGLARTWLYRDKDFGKAEPYFKRALSLLEPRMDSDEVLLIMSDLSTGYLQYKKDIPMAASWIDKALERNKRRNPSNDYWKVGALLQKAQISMDSAQWAQAEQALKEDEALMARMDGKDGFRVDWRGLYTRMVQVQEKTGNKDALKLYQDRLKAVK